MCPIAAHRCLRLRQAGRAQLATGSALFQGRTAATDRRLLRKIAWLRILRAGLTWLFAVGGVSTGQLAIDARRRCGRREGRMRLRYRRCRYEGRERSSTRQSSRICRRHRHTPNRLAWRCIRVDTSRVVRFSFDRRLSIFLDLWWGVQARSRPNWACHRNICALHSRRIARSDGHPLRVLVRGCIRDGRCTGFVGATGGRWVLGNRGGCRDVWVVGCRGRCTAGALNLPVFAALDRR
jgi:hypothetical protein